MSDITEENSIYDVNLQEYLLKYLQAVMTGPRVSDPVLFIDDNYEFWRLGDWYPIHTWLKPGPLCTIRTRKSEKGIKVKPHNKPARRVFNSSDMQGRFDEFLVRAGGTSNPELRQSDKDRNLRAQNGVKIVDKAIYAGDGNARTGTKLRRNLKMIQPANALLRRSKRRKVRRKSVLAAKVAEGTEREWATSAAAAAERQFRYQILCTAVDARGETEGVITEFSLTHRGEPNWDDIIGSINTLLEGSSWCERGTDMTDVVEDSGR